MRASADPVVIEAVAPPVRIRHLLLLGLLLALGFTGVPRMRAAFRLHSAATAFADYALCMVGPTGPSLLRDNPAEFRRLARRRLIVAGASDRPFSRCAKGAYEVTQSPETERAHRVPAVTFVEYGSDVDGAAVPGGSTRLDELAVTTKSLAELAETAWPFVRGGYTSLVQASAYTTEAPHPAELPRPGAGRGLPPARSLSRCTAPESGGAFVLTLSPDRRTKIVRSVTPEGVTSDASLAPAEARVFSASCDDGALVVALGREGGREVALFACAYLGRCGPVALPRLGEAGPSPRYPLDIARVDGVTVLASRVRGIVRVASTRDAGRTWTPFTVAFDSEAHRELHFDAGAPDHLFVSGHRLVLYAVASHPSATFPLLVSDDAGASFHAP
jgi:hypothetical protein